jgi:hypothetical protein
VVTRTDYNQIAVNAAYSVLIEIVRVLGEYRDNIVLIGGWVPQFLFQNIYYCFNNLKEVFKSRVVDNVHALHTGTIPLPQKMKGVCTEFCANPFCGCEIALPMPFI